MMLCRSSLFAALVVVATLSHTVHAHTWIDCIDTDRSVVYDNARAWIYGGETSKGRCKGYINNYPGRGDSTINDKMTYKVLMDDVVRGAAPCPANSGVGGDAKGFPHLKVHAGEKFYYGYLDNGHTSKDKAGRGTFYGVYWTGEPDSSLASTTDLTDERLVDGALHDFDDGNCGQTYEDGDFSGSILSGRAGNDYPCVGNLAIPAGTKPGVYNLIWFWRFYNEKVNAAVAMTGGHYGGAAYSSCFQVEVLAGGEMGSEAKSTTESPVAKIYVAETSSPVSPVVTQLAVTTTAPPASTSPSTPAPTTAPVTPKPVSQTPGATAAGVTANKSPTTTSPPTQAPTQAPTQSPTQSPTQAPTQSPTQPPMTTSPPNTNKQQQHKDCGVQGHRQLDSTQQQHLRG